MDKKKHILVISQYFYPEEFRINNICEEWIKRGYEVTVVTGIPNYPEGKFYKGYGIFKQREEQYKGINIIRLPIVARGNCFIMMTLNYLSFVISGFFWKTITKIKADKVFIFEVSPMTQALVGVWYSKKNKIPCYIYVQDLWPENVQIVAGINNNIVIKTINKMVDYIYKNCNRIFATSPSFVRMIEGRNAAFDMEGSKVIYWPQFAEEYYKPCSKQPLSDVEDDGAFKIFFTGNIGYAQGLSVLLYIAEKLHAKKVNCKFYIIGDGRFRRELEKEIFDKKIDKMFCLLGRKPASEISKYLAYGDFAFLSFADNELFHNTIPAKLQTYMACGIPIMAIASGETKRIIEEAQCGFCIEFQNVSKLDSYIDIMLQYSKEKMGDMRQHGLIYCDCFFNKSRLMDEIEKYLI